jgi:hypothetical protein
MRQRLIRCLLFVTSAMLLSLSAPAGTGHAVSACDATVAPGGDIQTALDATPPGGKICISSGTYAITSPLVPKSAQKILAAGKHEPLITCRTVRFCFDGTLGPDRVTLRRLVLEGALNGDVRTGERWTLDGVEARGAALTGIEVRSANVKITGSYAHDNGKLGISAVGATNLRIVGTEVAFNPTDPSFGIGVSGGLKLNGVIGLVMRKNYVHDNAGGAGIWLDADSKNFQIVSNRSLNNAREEIRVEISCFGTVQSNTVAGGDIAGIDIFNAHDVDASSNTVAAPAGGLFGIRMFGNGRDTTGGTGACMIAGAYENDNNQAVSNSVTTIDGVTVDGVVDAGGITTGNSWSGNAYDVPDCAGLQWRWWDGTSKYFVDFVGWQAFGQDLTGSCV